MNIATAVKPAPSVRDHGRYILRRVADCFLRENYRGIALGKIVPAKNAPFDRLFAQTEHYLAHEHLNCAPVLAVGSPITTSIVPIRALPGKPPPRHMGKSALQIMGGMPPMI